MRACTKFFFKQDLLVTKFQQALPAKTILVFFSNEFPGSYRKLQAMTLAIANISRLAFKRTLTTGAVFELVFTIVIFHYRQVEEMLLNQMFNSIYNFTGFIL